MTVQDARRDGEALSTGATRPTRKVSGDTRLRVLTRCEYRCFYCGLAAYDLELDHVVPWSAGGSNLHWNLVAACQDCNGRKGATLPPAVLVVLVRLLALRQPWGTSARHAAHQRAYLRACERGEG